MYTKLLDAQQHYQRRLAMILMIIEVIAFNFLMGCANSQNASNTTKATAVAITGEQTSVGKLMWSDEFSGSASTIPDPNKWTASFGGNGWGNQQLEYDTNNLNAYQDGHGNLVLEARKGNPEGLQCWYGPCQYTSARITTEGHFSFTYGRLEARIKVPYGQGIWPAFWLLGSNCATAGWPTCGEIDVMEHKGNETTITHAAAHGPNNFTADFSYMLSQSTFTDSFHTFALQWDPSHLYYFVDGIRYGTLDKASLTNPQDWVFNHPFNIALNVAVGGKWDRLGNPNSTTVFPQKMYVSYVRLYSI